MVVSVNTNAGAMLALQALRKTSGQLSTLRITTGLKVNGPQDDPATFAIAQNLRAEIASVAAVRTTLSLGQSTVDVAIDGATAVSDLLTEMKERRSKAASLAWTQPPKIRCNRTSPPCAARS